MNATIAIIAAIRQHIISSCIEAAGGQLFPCVKQSVYAVVITADGRAYYGANWMTSADVTICPRILANTASYELCSTVCGQGTEFHAERQAMWSALYDGADLTGAEMFITGHTYCCDTCRAAMYEEGITYAASIDSGKYYERGETTMKEQLPAPPEEIFINLNDFKTVMAFVATAKAEHVKLYKHGQTQYTDIFHDGKELYSNTKRQRHTYNIYGEPTFVYDDIRHFEGYIVDGFGILKGAATSIELQPLQFSDFEFDVTDIDLDF